MYDAFDSRCTSEMKRRDRDRDRRNARILSQNVKNSSRRSKKLVHSCDVNASRRMSESGRCCYQIAIDVYAPRSHFISASFYGKNGVICNRKTKKPARHLSLDRNDAKQIHSNWIFIGDATELKYAFSSSSLFVGSYLISLSLRKHLFRHTKSTVQTMKMKELQEDEEK